MGEGIESHLPMIGTHAAPPPTPPKPIWLVARWTTTSFIHPPPKQHWEVTRRICSYPVKKYTVPGACHDR